MRKNEERLMNKRMLERLILIHNAIKSGLYPNCQKLRKLYTEKTGFSVGEATIYRDIEALRNSFKYAKNKYDFEIIAISVLKEHCHMIISASNLNDIPQIIRTIKFNFSINVSEKFICPNSIMST